MVAGVPGSSVIVGGTSTAFEEVIYSIVHEEVNCQVGDQYICL